MIRLPKFFGSGLNEPWLAFNRVWTVNALRYQIQRNSSRLAYEPRQGSLLYVAASTLPYHISGYTTRTHEVIRALRALAPNVHVMTRPGYPWDRKDRQQDAIGDETLVDDVYYQHVNAPANNRPVLHYVAQAAKVVAKMAEVQRVSVIHAASNHVNALPALMAARQLGIPFQYEMRGLWELTRISRQPGFEQTQAYRQGMQLEALVATQADRLFVISQQLGRYVHEQWGVATERMALLPNCVSPERFLMVKSDKADPWTIGYAGSLIGYEGLDTLIEAVDRLARAGDPVRVRIIGGGEALPELEALVRRLGLSEQVCFFGKLPPAAARQALERCAVVCIPRKPFKVCEIVTPIKLVEALAMGKPVIVPDLPVFRDEMGTNPAGWFFKAGDPVDLAHAIKAALSDQNALAALGQRAREYAITQRRWSDFVVDVLPIQQDKS